MSNYTFYVETEDGQIVEVEYISTPNTLLEKYKIFKAKRENYDLENFIKVFNIDMKAGKYEKGKQKGFFLTKGDKVIDYYKVNKIWAECTIGPEENNE